MIKEENELLELILEEVEQRLENVKNELVDIMNETLGQTSQSRLLPTREEAREKVRQKVIVMLNYMKQWRNNSDKYVADQLGVTEHTIKDEWRVLGRSIPRLQNYEALKALYLTERRLHGELEEEFYKD